MILTREYGSPQLVYDEVVTRRMCFTVPYGHGTHNFAPSVVVFQIFEVDIAV